MPYSLCTAPSRELAHQLTTGPALLAMRAQKLTAAGRAAEKGHHVHSQEKSKKGGGD